MQEDRQYARTDCDEKCMIHLKGWYYPATVKNISLRGALVTPCNPLNAVRSGESCNVIMSEDSFCEYYCNIVRVSGYDVALRIIDGYSDSPFTHILAKLHGGYWKYKSLQTAENSTTAFRTRLVYREGTALARTPIQVRA